MNAVNKAVLLSFPIKIQFNSFIFSRIDVKTDEPEPLYVISKYSVIKKITTF